MHYVVCDNYPNIHYIILLRKNQYLSNSFPYGIDDRYYVVAHEWDSLPKQKSSPKIGEDLKSSLVKTNLIT